MNAIVILIGLVALSFLLSQNPLLRRTRGLLALPVSIFLGWSFSPAGVFPILPSTLQSLNLGIMSVLFWVSFLGGVRTDLRLLKQGPTYSRSSMTVLIFALVALCSYFSLAYWLPIDQVALSLKDPQILSQSTPRLILIALWIALLFSGSSLVSTLPTLRERPLHPHLDNLKVVLFSGAIGGLLNFGTISIPKILSLTIIMFMSLFLFRLLLPHQEKLSTPQRLKLGGILALLTGLAHGLALNVSIAGFVVGVACSQFLSKKIHRDSRIRSTEVPFRLFLAFVVGLSFDFQLQFFIFGLLLAAIRYLLKHLFQKKLFYDSEAWRFSGFALLIVLGHSLTTHQRLDLLILMNVVVAGVLGTDTLRLIENLIFERDNKNVGGLNHEI